MILTLPQAERIVRLLSAVWRDVEVAGADLAAEPVARIGPASDGGVVVVVCAQVAGLDPVRLRPVLVTRHGSQGLVR